MVDLQAVYLVFFLEGGLWLIKVQYLQEQKVSVTWFNEGYHKKKQRIKS